MIGRQRDLPECVERADAGGRTLSEAEGASLLDVCTSARAPGQGLLDEVGLSHTDGLSIDVDRPRSMRTHEDDSRAIVREPFSHLAERDHLGAAK